MYAPFLLKIYVCIMYIFILNVKECVKMKFLNLPFHCKHCKIRIAELKSKGSYLRWISEGLHILLCLW